MIYIVEDDEGIQEVYEGAFEGLYDVEIFGDAKSFLPRWKTGARRLPFLT